MKARLIIVAALAALTLTGAAQARTVRHHHKPLVRCHTGMVRRTVRVPRRHHGKRVWIHVSQCVRTPIKPKPARSVTVTPPQVSPTPAPPSAIDQPVTPTAPPAAPVPTPSPAPVPPPAPPQVGFFCGPEPSPCDTLAGTSQILIHADQSTATCNGTVFSVTQGAQTVGGYVDDSLGATGEATAQQCGRSEGLSSVWAGLVEPGSIPGYNWNLPQLAGGLEEWYPILTTNDAVPPIPPSGPDGYFLQAFSWASYTSVASWCTPAICQAPTVTQMQQMWCAALAQHPPYIFWFIASTTNIPLVLQVEQTPCPAS